MSVRVGEGRVACVPSVCPLGLARSWVSLASLRLVPHSTLPAASLSSGHWGKEVGLRALSARLALFPGKVDLFVCPGGLFVSGGPHFPSYCRLSCLGKMNPGEQVEWVGHGT